MVLGAEIGLLVLGIYALFAGKLPSNKKERARTDFHCFANCTRAME